MINWNFIRKIKIWKSNSIFLKKIRLNKFVNLNILLSLPDKKVESYNSIQYVEYKKNAY